jgi:hypothetical protein
MEKEQLERLLKYLFTITVFLSLLYLFQLLVGKNILVHTNSSKISILGIKTIRFYNLPDMIQFFVFMALFCNPYKGPMKIITTILLVAALLGAFHRSWIGVFFLSLALAYTLRLPRLQRIKVLSIASFLLLGIIVFAGAKFIKSSRTFVDLTQVVSGDFADVEIDMDGMSDATFTFRMAHMLERNQYLLEHPQAMIFGAGLLPEDSKKVDKLFDFNIGLLEELSGSTIQLDTADISYSLLLLRYGYAGTFIYLMIYIYLMIFFYKKRDNPYGLFSFLFLFFSFGVSFFSANLTIPVTLLLPMMSYCIICKMNIENTDTINYEI